MKTLYEVNWHYNNDTLVRISVTPIKVLREGILPGCSAVSITAVDSNGHQFQGCPQDYFETEEAAWKQATIDLQETIASEERDVCEAQRRIKGLRNVLLAIQGAEQQPAPDMLGLTEALRQYQHNDGSGLVFGYDKLLVDQYVAGLVEALELAQGFLRNKGHSEEDPFLLGAINAALSAYRKQGDEA